MGYFTVYHSFKWTNGSLFSPHICCSGLWETNSDLYLVFNRLACTAISSCDQRTPDPRIEDMRGPLVVRPCFPAYLYFLPRVRSRTRRWTPLFFFGVSLHSPDRSCIVPFSCVRSCLRRFGVHRSRRRMTMGLFDGVWSSMAAVF